MRRRPLSKKATISPSTPTGASVVAMK